MYHLEKYKGKSTRHTCPSCGKLQSFTLYVDSITNLPLNPKVGKCNREIKCGYHYPPKQYFIDNPSSCTDEVRLVSTSKNNSSLNLTNVQKRTSPSPLTPSHKGEGWGEVRAGVGSIPFHYLEQSQSQNSNFISFLKKHFSENDIQTVCNKYLIGAAKNKEIIFWQIDINYKIHTGKIMQYNPETGKRLKHQSGAIDWVHNKLKKQKKLPEDFNLQQCFFGEHLLAIYPTATVAIVESEKSAIIASIVFPDLIWLAAGSINGLTLEKCQVLKGRNVILYPDLGACDIWNIKAKEIERLYNSVIVVSKILENISTTEDNFQGLDISDFMIY